MRFLSLILCLGLLATQALAFGQPATPEKTFTHEEGGIQFDVPDGWKAEVDGEQISVSAPDKSISISLWVPEEDTFEAALDALDEVLAQRIKNMKLDGEAKSDTHNGMKHGSMTGSGQVEGADVLWSVDVLLAKKPVIVLTFASAENFKKHAEELGELIKSIRKAS